MQLSIIIVSWNTAKLTCQAIKSIYRHTKNFSFEVILVDNYSTDDTIDQIAKLKQKYPNLAIIKNSNNFGFSKANNIGVKKSKGEYLFFLNSDTLIFDDSIKQALNYINKFKSQIGILAPQLLNSDKSIQASVFPPQTIINAILQFCFNKTHQFSQYIPKKSQPVNAVSGAALFISRQDFNQVKGWDERYFFYFEDLDLCRKIHRLGKNVFYYNKAKIIHLHGQSGKNINSNQSWKRLIPGSIIYHGYIKHHLLSAILKVCQKINTKQ